MTTKASMVRGIPSSLFHEHADYIRKHLQTIERHDKDGVTAAEYEAKILDRTYQVWALGEWEGIALTRVLRDSVRLEWVAGRNRHRWQKELDAVLREWRDHLGKKRLIVAARPGWAKLARELGYREMQRVYEI